MVPSGQFYRAVSLPRSERITLELAAELSRVLDRFAAEACFTREHPVEVLFRPGIFGHHRVGRAVDIYGVGGRSIAGWMADWRNPCPRERAPNLGWRLYKSLQCYGRWARPRGYPVQLFGPWTRREGPWRPISDFLLFAHRDHIHVAR